MTIEIETQRALFKREFNRWLKALPEAERKELDVAKGVYTFAPGRGNLIGEHIDYNGGMVSPITIGAGCFCAAIPRKDSELHVVNLAGEVSEGELTHTAKVWLPLDSLFSAEGKLLPEIEAQRFLGERDRWAGLIFGAVYVLLEERLITGERLHGLQFAMLSTVPIASGLSSSAALEVSSLAAASAVFGVKLSGSEMARLGQRMEHAMRGVPCGRMDQSAAALGRPNAVLALDCTKWDSKWHTLPKGWTALFVDTAVPRSLATSAYAQRRASCEQGLAAINRIRADAAPNLCSLTPKEFSRDASHAGLDAETLKRCQHAVEEQERVRSFMTALDKGTDISKLGTLLYASHQSLKELYEVSCPELDAVVEIAKSIGLKGGIAGARMQGAGFGGCAVLLVRDDAVDAVKRRVSREYAERTGRKCSFVSGSSPGTVAFGVHPLA